MRRSTRWAVLLGAATAAASSKKKKPKKPVNVLWLLVDDLRPQLGAYGQRETKTPRLDALAREGVVFERAYCQLSVCAPSRNSFMTGRRPDSLRVYNFVDHFRSTTPDAIALPEGHTQPQDDGEEQQAAAGGAERAETWGELMLH